MQTFVQVPYLLRAKAHRKRPTYEMTTGKPSVTLFSIPASCFAARARLVIYAKELDTSQDVEIAPVKLEGLKSTEYLGVNPLGKIPAAILHEAGDKDDYLFESSVICEYLAERYDHIEPSFIPQSFERRAHARLITVLIDQYIAPYHSYMYRKVEEGADRAAKVDKMKIGFDAIERVLDDQGPFATGKDMTVGDCGLWGCLPFYDYMLPTFFGWEITQERPKLARWISQMHNNSEAARRVYKEVYAELENWRHNGRWEKLGIPAVGDPKPLVV